MIRNRNASKLIAAFVVLILAVAALAGSFFLNRQSSAEAEPLNASLPTPSPEDSSSSLGTEPVQNAAATETPIQSETQTLDMNGFKVTASDFRSDGRHLLGAICYNLPDGSDQWMIWKASLQVGKNEISDFETRLISLEKPSAANPAGQHCDQISFLLPEGADLSGFTVSIFTFDDQPREGEYCSRLQKALTEKNAVIQVKCNEENGITNLSIAGKPAGMSQEEAQQILDNGDWFAVPGPWVFTGSLMP